MQPALTTAIPARKFKLTLLGPAFIAAIGYIDPGNFATNIQAGSTFGYQEADQPDDRAVGHRS